MASSKFELCVTKIPWRSTQLVSFGQRLLVSAQIGQTSTKFGLVSSSFRLVSANVRLVSTKLGIVSANGSCFGQRQSRFDQCRIGFGRIEQVSAKFVLVSSASCTLACVAKRCSLDSGSFLKRNVDAGCRVDGGHVGEGQAGEAR